jgi:hypothetical protein
MELEERDCDLIEVTNLGLKWRHKVLLKIPP